ncbi:hypothetical protein AEQ27_06325 [Frigoribacterium sp. RIT-PI-h]|nr:hypothetical protein AEQ27_06325 [Frigoribacterium sp. RIT-PI-h]
MAQVGAAEHAREQPHELPARQPLDHEHVEQSVVEHGVGRDLHAAAERLAVADRDGGALDGRGAPVELGAVGDRRRTHRRGRGGAVGARAPRGPARPVGRLVHDGVEARRDHAGEPGGPAVGLQHASGVDGGRLALEQSDEEARGSLGIVVGQPEGPGRVVAGARRHQSQRHVRARDEVGPEVHHAVAADDDQGVRASAVVGVEFAAGRGHEVVVARLGERDDRVAGVSEPGEHPVGEVLPAAGGGAGVDRHDQAEGRRGHGVDLASPEPARLGRPAAGGGHTGR